MDWVYWFRCQSFWGNECIGVSDVVGVMSQVDLQEEGLWGCQLRWCHFRVLPHVGKPGCWYLADQVNQCKVVDVAF